MECWLLILGIAQLIALSVGALFLWKYLPSYLSQKGKNLATQEDIGKITREVEQVKSEYTERLEGIAEHLRYRNQLRLAALDRRLQAHQEAYALWQNLMDNVRDREKVGDAVVKCQEWWRENSLYLDAEARRAFITAFKSAPTYCQIWTELREADAGESERREDVLNESWESVSSAGKVIVEAVELPSLAGEEPKAVDPSDDEDG